MGKKKLERKRENEKMRGMTLVEGFYTGRFCYTTKPGFIEQQNLRLFLQTHEQLTYEQVFDLQKIENQQ